jgi:hypothetical protein
MPFFRFVARSTMARSEPDLAIYSIRGTNYLSNLRWRPDLPRLWTVPQTDRQAIDIAEHQTGDYDAIEVWEGSRFIWHYENPDSMNAG